jgi:hypothetical protein
MTIAFVLGNGVSRKNISLLQLQQVGIIYGCNALYKEFTPTVLVSTDRPISTEIQNSGYPLKHRHHTRKPVPGQGSLSVPQPYYGFSSGPIALAIAAQDGHQCIYLLGFDIGPGTDNLFNNIYAGYEHYKKAGSGPTYTGNWIRQIRTVVNDFPYQEFVRVKGPTTADIADFAGLPNLKNLYLDKFIERLQTMPCH